MTAGGEFWVTVDTRVLGALQERYPGVRIRVRLDGGFAGPELLTFLDEVCVDYVIGLPGNPRLERLAAPYVDAVWVRAALTSATQHDYAETRYAAKSWDRERRVVIKAEVVAHPGRELKDNPRFAVTNLKGDPQRIYERVYSQRGEIENRIKELQLGLTLGRTSSTRFLANQLRVLLTAAAFVLLQEVRRHAAGTRFARAQVWTLREQLLKLGAWAQVSARRIVLHLPAAFPFVTPWRRVALALGPAPDSATPSPPHPAVRTLWGGALPATPSGPSSKQPKPPELTSAPQPHPKRRREIALTLHAAGSTPPCSRS